MIPSERQDFIYRYVYENRTASINALADLMNVSHMTIRRDIQLLEHEGKVVSVSGGIKLNDVLRHEMRYSDKALIHHRSKQIIGKAAAELVDDGLVIYVDAGTTTFELAKYLGEKFNTTIITNDFSISQYLMNKAQINLFHTGGLVDKRNFSSVGISAANFIKTLNVDIAFISSSSWDAERGISTPYEEKAIVKQAVIEVSRKKILVADSSKYGKYGLYSICPLNKMDTIITDSYLPLEAQGKIRNQNVELKLVDI
ncbi:MAG: DeoR/GlpR family DNA-binding transcription regulator [Pantoea sp.]|uniref:DeoR/GlpR family DNA-binding transcription regulator n=1 Tax=Pantoea sp. TaxID=69393 RepID=UPI00239BB790|nr:DeoR/GlpR family DNA-binding transcription regulator [Pantoea sp.]MDE1187297.1 DeoR/GlpR family DNA-binding transcription regulator [Pantoea sp.]